MNRKIKTSCSRRPFYHEQQFNPNQFLQSSITRPPTSHPYSTLNHYRSSTKIRNQYESNYFSPKLFNQKKYNQSQQKQKWFQKPKQPTLVDDTIPKNFKILLTQVKVLLKNAQIQDDKVKQVTKGFTKKLKEIAKQNEDLKVNAQACMKQITEQKSVIQKLNQKIKQHNEAKTSNTIQKQFLLYGSSKKKQPTQFQLMLENLHLNQLNTSYLNTIKELKMSLDEQKTQVKKDIRDSDSGTDILRFHNRINYLEMKISNGENIQNQLTAKNQQYLQHIQDLTKQIKKLTQELHKVTQERNEYRQRAFMQKQDSETNSVRQNFLLFSIKKLREVNKNLTNKLLNIASQDGIKKLKQLDPNPYFQYEVDFFKSIKSVYFDGKMKEYKLSIKSRKQQYEVQPMGLQQEYLEYRKHEQVNLVALNYFKPTFFSFIEECVTNDINGCRVKGSTSVSRIFIQIIRAIMNCKINEFLLVSGQEKFTRFPEFVYSWFEKFYFNSQKNQVCALEPYMQKPITQDTFYRDLMNVRLDQSWEIITLREFILQQLNLEELYFYLMCQNLLYKKAGISEQIQYQGQFSILVEFSAAKSVLDLVLSDFQSWNVSFLTSKLRQKIIVKKNIECIESGFFLRCLIEYYKIERVNRFKYLSKLCDQFKSSSQNGLRFSSFISVINRFTEISSQEKMRIYRDCYSVGRGKITADVIFTVCTQQLIFLRYLKLKCFYKLPILVFNNQLRRNKKKQVQQEDKPPKKQILCVQPSDPYIYDVFIGLNRLLNNEDGFTKRIQKLGVSDILQHFEVIKKLFAQKSTQKDSSLLRCKHFVHFISYTMQKIRELSFQNFYQLLEQNNKKKNDGNFWIEINEAALCEMFVQEYKITFQIFERLNSFRIWKNDVYNFRVNNAARKIQRQVRKKFIEPFMQLYKIIYSQTKNNTDETLKKMQN